MGKKLYYLDESEKRRILELHKIRIENKHLLNEGVQEVELALNQTIEKISNFTYPYGPFNITIKDSNMNGLKLYDYWTKSYQAYIPYNKQIIDRLSQLGFNTNNQTEGCYRVYKNAIYFFKCLSSWDPKVSYGHMIKYPDKHLPNISFTYLKGQKLNPDDSINSDENTNTPADNTSNESNVSSEETVNDTSTNTGTQQSSNNANSQQAVNIRADYRVLTPQKIAELRKKIGSTSTGNQLTQDDLNKIMEKLKEKSG